MKENLEDKGLVSIEDQLYNIRMLMFMETSPQSNKYRQILLTDSQYRKISKTLEDSHPSVHKDPTRPDHVDVELTLSDNTYTLPDLNETL